MTALETVEIPTLEPVVILALGTEVIPAQDTAIPALETIVILVLATAVLNGLETVKISSQKL